MNRLRNLDIKYLKGIGPKRAELLGKQLGIKSYRDLLYHFPTRYLDRSSIYRVKDLSGEMPMIQLKGRFIAMTVQGEGAKTRLVGVFTDGTGTMEVVWFRRIKQIRESYHTGNEYIIFGKPELFNNRWSMVHPEVDTPAATTAAQGLRGVYPLTETLRNQGIGARQIFTWVQTALAASPVITETLPRSIIERLKLMSLRESLINIHNPQSNEKLQAARLRLKFEELFYIQLNIQRYSRRRNAQLTGFRFPRIGQYFNTLYSQQMPFELTGAQKRVIKEIRADMGTGKQMNRLLQGDVGSGKTLVALLCMLIALDNGTQACLMAPTEILATQHYETISSMVAPIGINVKLLTGSTRKKERDIIHSQLTDGSLHILIGTHAVIEDNVQFKNLGFVVIDEQHRFGVAQRARLWQKNMVVPHVLVMTATPIPRTLAMTIYGDLSVSVIDELPPGRKPVTTLLRYDNNRMAVYQALGKQLKQGRQAYIVYPLIQENEKLDLKCLEEGYEMIRETFRDYKVCYVHGKMKPAEKEHQMMLFATNQAQILVATTVIEVGVNVPNASTMIIENAERFGLSQLHQLRGRVGRGAEQSYCILMTHQKIQKETRQRLEIMTSTTDGFVIAEADLKMRGPGDMEGTMQSGIAFDLHIANLATDGQIVQLARDAADDTLDKDPELALPENSILRSELLQQASKAVDWSRIS
ncbi:ATP-dependent DNA helicase RecG [uncultured Muribaculum sp.]|uniref:ATP-dependent DNA helicase RecG n=1 Tax=uncultured Muribaculum sp. TaxID=1918613 RepID=UPI000F461BB7|nr:ATP-dependent DNA helicase RecG [uncultured Muribaculum sp.]ROT13717.1 ATP-dependent DNA helicase RecG [Muribaculaceae bacterium Isolate-102 (HZI)]